MTKIVFFRSGGVFYGFEEQGHTGYADAGEDVLCAALSAMTMLIINTVEVAYASDVEYTVDEGATLKADLEAAMAALVGNADYTALDALLAEVKALKEADYTAETWTVLADAIAAAEALKANTATTADDVAAAVTALAAAKDALAKAEVPTEQPTEKPTEQPTEPAGKEGGCGGTIALGATVVVAILGTAIVLKKKD